MSLLAQLVDIKPPLKFLLLIFPSLCNSRVCKEKVYSLPGTTRTTSLLALWSPLASCQTMQIYFFLLQTHSSCMCTTTCCWHCWLGWTLFFLCFFSGCLSTPFIFICGITTQIVVEEYYTRQAAFLLPAIEHFVCTLGIEITKPIALKSLMSY